MRRGVIERTRPSLEEGAERQFLSISRSLVHYESQGETAMSLHLVRAVDKELSETVLRVRLMS